MHLVWKNWQATERIDYSYSSPQFYVHPVNNQLITGVNKIVERRWRIGGKKGKRMGPVDCHASLIITGDDGLEKMIEERTYEYYKNAHGKRVWVETTKYFQFFDQYLLYHINTNGQLRLIRRTFGQETPGYPILGIALARDIPQVLTPDVLPYK